MNAITEEKIDILGNLPREIAFKILINLTGEDIDSVVKCCKKWREDVNYEFFWKALYKREYFDFLEEPDAEVYQHHLRRFSSRWQGRYMYNQMLQRNVENNIFDTVKVRLSESRGDLIYFDDRTLILAETSSDYESQRKFAIIDSSTGLVEKELIFMIDYVGIIKHENLLIAVTKNFGVKIWNIDSCQCITNIEMDYNIFVQACSLLACKHLILIGGLDKFVPILFAFNMETQNFSLLGKNMCVCCTNDTIAIAEKDGFIEIFDTNLQSLAQFKCFKTKELIKITMNHDFLVKAFLSLRGDCYLTVWNIKTKENFKIRIKDRDRLYINLAGNTLVCTTNSDRCEVWDMRTQKRLFKVDAKKLIYKVAVLGNRYIFLYFDEFPIEVYHIQKCKLIRKYKYFDLESRLMASTKTKLVKKETRRLDWEWKILNFEFMSD